MAKQKTPDEVTKEILKKEVRRLETKIDSVEKQLNAKIDSKVDIAVESMKEHMNGRIAQVNTRIDGMEHKMETGFDRMKGYFEGLVGMVVLQNKKIDKALVRLEKHEHRITKLETH